MSPGGLEVLVSLGGGGARGWRGALSAQQRVAQPRAQRAHVVHVRSVIVHVVQAGLLHM